VKLLSDDTPYALKQLKLRYPCLSDVGTLPEVGFLQALCGCPNIIELIEGIYDPTTQLVSIVLELCDCNLYEYLKSGNSPLNERVVLFFMYQLLKALDAMHCRGMFHRDVKPENCMINRKTYELKLVTMEFGYRGMKKSTFHDVVL
jgi:renal tumor antigen